MQRNGSGTTMAKAVVHSGPLGTIGKDSSPGLRFLKAFLAVIDSLSPTTDLTPFLSPTAALIINGSPPTPAGKITAMLKMRSERLKVFRRSTLRSWDVEKEGGKRTVLYESVSETIFKDDIEGKPVEVSEFSTIELVPQQGGVEGLVASGMKTFMDPSPVMQRRMQIAGIAERKPS